MQLLRRRLLRLLVLLLVLRLLVLLLLVVLLVLVLLCLPEPSLLQWRRRRLEPREHRDPAARERLCGPPRIG